MAQRQGQRHKGQSRTPTATNTTTAGRARSNGAAKTSTAETAQEERAHATGRRARARIAQEQAAKRRRLGIILGAITAVVVVAIAVAAFVLSRNGQTTALADANTLNVNAKELSLGAKAPDFTSSTIDGKKYTLSAQRGHPVLIEDFAIWCPHCQNETATLKQLNATYQSKGLRIFSVLASPYGKDYDTSGGTDLRLADRTDLDWFKNTFGIPYPIFVDHNFATANKYPLVSGPTGAGFPSIYIVDPNGVIRYKSTAEAPYPTLAKAVDAAMKGQSTTAVSSSKSSHR